MSQVPSWKVQRAAINAAIALEVLLSLSSTWGRRERLAFGDVRSSSHRTPGNSFDAVDSRSML